MDAAGLRTLEEWFARHRGKSVEVVLAGQILGGRYGESPQTPRTWSCEADTLRIEFGTTEVLTVERPFRLRCKKDALLIQRADSVVFGWHSYGLPQTPENWCEKRYRRVENKVHFEGTTGQFLLKEHDLDCSYRHFVELSLA